MPYGGERRSKITGWPLTFAVAAVLAFLFFIRSILPPFILAAALGFVLTPPVEAVHRRLRVPRWMAALAAYVIVLLALAVLAYAVAGPLVRDVMELTRTLPQHLQASIEQLSGLAGDLAGYPIDAGALTGWVLGELRKLQDSSALLAFAGYGIAGVFGGILCLVLLGYFLVSGPRVADGVFWLVPPEYRDEVDAVSRKILPMLWRYLVGLLVVVAYTSAVAWIGFGPIFHLPLAPLLAVVVGVLELIPVFGPAAAIALVILTAIRQAGLFEIVGLIVFAVALRVSIDQLLGPAVLGRAVRLHPGVVMFSFLSGAILFGVVGLILAVPVAASIKIVLANYYGEPIARRRG